MTYPIDGPLANVPVQASYQPHQWLKVELELDEDVAVPPDPAEEGAVLERIRRICRTHLE